MLSYLELIDLVESGVIKKLSFSQVNSASIDVRLGKWILKEIPPVTSDERTELLYGKAIPSNLHKINLQKRDHLKTIQHDLSQQPFVLMPGEFCLAQTIEEFHFPDNVAAEFKLKSSGARIGLNNLLAGHCDPGWKNSVLTLELQNTTRHHAIILQYGDAIGQMVFHRVTPVPEDQSYSVRGRYNNDQVVSGVKQ